MNKLCALIPILWSCASIAVATNWQYAILIDAGSSGSRLHLYQYDLSTRLPTIHDIFHESNASPLAAYATDPKQAGPSLQSLLDDAQKTVTQLKVEPNTVPVSILGTAGMRLIDLKDQRQIYANTRLYLKQHYAFRPDRIETISGQMEGVYDWLDVNYLANTFKPFINTLGILDMGGASTEIAFQTNDRTPSKDTVTLSLNHTRYTVHSQSFLGLGQTQARLHINASAAATACYPDDYPLAPGLIGHFNYDACQQGYDQWIQVKMKKPLPPMAQSQKFMAFGGTYHTYRFFNIELIPTKAQAETRIRQLCSQSWPQLKQKYPHENEQYLANYCADGTYITQLFYKRYGLHDGQIMVSNTVDQQDIDWALGAILYQLTQTNDDAR